MTKDQFNKLTKAEKRVWIAKDVIARLDSRQISPRGGAFWSNDFLFKNKSDNIQFAVTRTRQPCEVCAKGGLFVTWAANFNSFKFSDGFNDINLPPEILNLFGKNQLTLIEIAFEARWYDWWDLMEDEEKQGDVNPKYKNDLRGIMQNIIDNAGIFVFDP